MSYRLKAGVLDILKGSTWAGMGEVRVHQDGSKWVKGPKGWERAKDDPDAEPPAVKEPKTGEEKAKQKQKRQQTTPPEKVKEADGTAIQKGEESGPRLNKSFSYLRDIAGR